jgi:hypothetical protein
MATKQDTSEQPVLTDAGGKEITVPAGYRKIEATFVRFENPGDKLEGIFKGFRHDPLTERVNAVFEIEDTEVVLASNVILNQKLSSVKPDSQCIVEYANEIKTPKGRRAKDFNVFVKEGR